MLEVTLGFVGVIVLFTVLSMLYVWRFRGELRFEGFSEYVRKGWPMFAPLNCFLYLMTQRRAKKPIMDITDFDELSPILDNWETIREEAQALWKNKYFEQTKDPDNKAYYDVGFRTFYKYGWGKFYLDWYGVTHNSALEMCPKTVEIVKKVKSVNGAMFSVLPAGSKLTRHLDPVACSLRLHLALDTPEDDACFINIDGTDYSWRNGKALLFDETYLHHAKNNTEDYRLILMCEVERPMNIFGRIFNPFFKLLMRMTVVPNTDQDKRGIANRVFSWVSPILRRSKALKQTNPVMYQISKWTTNIILLLIILAFFAGIFYLCAYIWTSLNGA